MYLYVCVCVCVCVRLTQLEYVQLFPKICKHIWHEQENVYMCLLIFGNLMRQWNPCNYNSLRNFECRLISLLHRLRHILISPPAWCHIHFEILSRLQMGQKATLCFLLQLIFEVNLKKCRTISLPIPQKLKWQVFCLLNLWKFHSFLLVSCHHAQKSGWYLTLRWSFLVSQQIITSSEWKKSHGNSMVLNGFCFQCDANICCFYVHICI